MRDPCLTLCPILCGRVEVRRALHLCVSVTNPDYMAVFPSVLKEQYEPRHVLNRFALSFKPKEQSCLRIELTYMDESRARIRDVRAVYLTTDDDGDQNHLGRELRRVDFRRLDPGKLPIVSDRFLTGTLMRGYHTLNLWIPSPEPFPKFNFTRNLLLSSDGVPDPTTGLNTLAEFKMDQ